MSLLSVSALAIFVFCLLMILLVFVWKDGGQEPCSPSESLSATGLTPSSVALGMAGSILETYDYGLYGFFTAEIGDAFFHGTRQLDTVSFTFATFACGFLMRPVGAILLGYIGDNYGRVVALKLGVAGMICSTCVIGLMPPKSHIGIFAPIMIIIMRLIQGLSAGGQVPGSFVYMFERAKPNRRCLVTSLVSLSLNLGIMLSSAVAAASHSFGAEKSGRWRFPFCLAAVLGAVAYWAGSQAEESEEYTKARQSKDLQQRSFFEALQVTWPAVWRIGSLSALHGVAYYTLYTWIPTYEQQLRQPPALPYALAINTIALALLSIMMLLWGWLADSARYEILVTAGAALLGMLACPFFNLLSLFDSKQPEVVFAAYVLFSIPFSLSSSLSYRWGIELVPDVSLRCVTVSTATGIFMAAFAGTAPYIDTKLIQTSWGILAPGLYIFMLSLLGFSAIVSTFQHKDA